VEKWELGTGGMPGKLGGQQSPAALTKFLENFQKLL